MGTQSEQLERKVHQARARLTETLEELRAGMDAGPSSRSIRGLRAQGSGGRVLPKSCPRNAAKPASAHADWSWDRMVDHSEQSTVPRSRQAFYSKGGR